MPSRMEIASSDPSLLRNAARTAEEFARHFMRNDIAGIAFLGAIARGCFDEAADIDAEVSATWDMANATGRAEVAVLLRGAVSAGRG
jgi:predicted nucleotidyltransferase